MNQQRSDVNGSSTNGTNSVCIRCTYPGCRCVAFKTSPTDVRQCSGCSHGWVPHALDKIGIIYQWDKRKFEVVNYDVVFDIASLVLFGTHGIPFRLHVCMYRLMAFLESDEATRITDQFDWTWEDFCRGCKLMDSDGNLRNTWNYANLTDETMILMHFLKYHPTQAIAEKFIQELSQQKAEDNPYLHVFSKPPDSGLQLFFSQNQAKSVTQLAPPSLSNGIHHSPFNGFPQAPQSAVSAPGIPNGKPMVLTNHSSQPPSRSLNGQDSGIPAINGNHVPQQLVFRTAMPNGSFQLHHVDMGHMQPAPAPPAGVNICPPNPNPVVQPVQSTTPGKRTLKPKPAAVVPVAPPVVAAEPVPIAPVAAAPFSPLSTSPVPKRVKTEAGTPPEMGTLVQNGKQQKSPARRVYCDNCQKSFCDKGALKIHYSAVHLKEMHRCTAKGCNMMFSSRRSRNRHSSNPNPRLHSNLFAPRRGGILLNDGEVPPQSNDGSDHNDPDDMMSGDEDDRSMSYDEIATMLPDESMKEASLFAPQDSPLPVDSKLVMALDDGSDLLDRITGDTHGPTDDVAAAEHSTLNGDATHHTSFYPTSAHFVSQHFNGHHASSSRNGSEGEENEDKLNLDDDLDEDEDSEQSEAALESLGVLMPTANRDGQGKIIVPVDPENSSRCVDCGKVFKNHFTVRTHYINVHLRVMHLCTVPGCRSQFPSVRSRDRHSANINLHDGRPIAVADSPEVAPPATVAPAFIG